jgi:hypothetical protein
MKKMLAVLLVVVLSLVFPMVSLAAEAPNLKDTAAQGRLDGAIAGEQHPDLAKARSCGWWHGFGFGVIGLLTNQAFCTVKGIDTVALISIGEHSPEYQDGYIQSYTTAAQTASKQYSSKGALSGLIAGTVVVVVLSVLTAASNSH